MLIDLKYRYKFYIFGFKKRFRHIKLNLLGSKLKMINGDL